MEVIGSDTYAKNYVLTSSASLSRNGNALLIDNKLIDISDPSDITVFLSDSSLDGLNTEFSIMAPSMNFTLFLCSLRAMPKNSTMYILAAVSTNPIVDPTQVGIAFLSSDAAKISTNILPDQTHGGTWYTQSEKSDIGVFCYFSNFSVSPIFPNITSYASNNFWLGSPVVNMHLENFSQYLLFQSTSSLSLVNISTILADRIHFLLHPKAELELQSQINSVYTEWSSDLSQSFLFIINGTYSLSITATTWEYNATIFTAEFPAKIRYFTSSIPEPGQIALKAISSTVYIAIGSKENWLSTESNTILLIYELTPTNLTLVKNVNIYSNCSYLKSMMDSENGMWVICVSTSENFYFTFRVDLPSLSQHCFIQNERAAEDISFASALWAISSDDNRLVLYLDKIFRFYDISSCKYANGSANLFAEFNSYRNYDDISLYSYYSSTLLLAREELSGSIYTFSDCQIGYHSNADLFCGPCPPGTSGPLCLPCPAGFVCDQSGTIYTTQLCPSGYYCPLGTKTSKYLPNVTGSPIPCPAGLYCPAGVSIGYVSDNVNSPKLCAIGYYCPENSSVPNAHRCPLHTLSSEGAKSIEDCTCEEGYYGYGGICVPCISNERSSGLCKCEGNVVSGCYLPNGNDWSLETIVELDISPVPCPVESIDGTNPCNPLFEPWNSIALPFPCAVGYTDRLCSRCISDYYANGKSCNKCVSSFKWTLPLTYLSIIIVVLLYVWHATPRKEAIIQISVFHFQSIYTLLTGGVQLDKYAFSFLQFSTTTSNLSIVAIECLFDWWTKKWTLTLTFLFPVVAALLAICACIVSLVFKRVTCAKLPIWEEEMAFYKAKAAKVLALMISLGYFSIMLSVLETLGCADADQGTRHYYLISFPWIECNNKWTGMIIVAVFGFFVEVVGFPLFLHHRMLKIKRMPEVDSWNEEVFGTFYKLYTPKYYFWELVVTARRFLTAILVAFFPFNNPTVLVGFFLIVLFYSSALKVNPYARTLDNIFDSSSQIVLLSSVFTGIIINFPLFSSYGYGLSWFILIINALFLVLTVVCLIESKAVKITTIFITARGYLITFMDFCKQKILRHTDSSSNLEEIPLISEKTK